MEVGFDCPENSGEWRNVKWRRGGSDEPLSGIQNKSPSCADIFDDDGNIIGVRII